MFAYGHKYDCSNIWLIYPQNKDVKNGIIQKFESSCNGLNISVSVYCLKLDDEGAFSSLLAQLKEEK